MMLPGIMAGQRLPAFSPTGGQGKGLTHRRGTCHYVKGHSDACHPIYNQV